MCFPNNGVNYESDVDDYFYDSDSEDDQTNDENHVDQEAEIEID